MGNTENKFCYIFFHIIVTQNHNRKRCRNLKLEQATVNQNGSRLCSRLYKT